MDRSTPIPDDGIARSRSHSYEQPGESRGSQELLLGWGGSSPLGYGYPPQEDYGLMAARRDHRHNFSYAGTLMLKSEPVEERCNNEDHDVDYSDPVSCPRANDPLDDSETKPGKALAWMPRFTESPSLRRSPTPEVKLQRDTPQAGAADAHISRYTSRPVIARPADGRRIPRNIPYRSDSANTIIDWGDEYSDYASTLPAVDENPPTLHTRSATPGAVPDAARVSFTHHDGQRGLRPQRQPRSQKHHAAKARKSVHRKKPSTARRHRAIKTIRRPFSPMRATSPPMLERYDSPETPDDRISEAQATIGGVRHKVACLPLEWALYDDEFWSTVDVIYQGKHGRHLSLSFTKLECAIGKQCINVQLRARGLPRRERSMNAYCSVKSSKTPVLPQIVRAIYGALKDQDKGIEDLAIYYIWRPQSCIKVIVDYYIDNHKKRPGHVQRGSAGSKPAGVDPGYPFSLQIFRAC
ncbi:hypothetical protein L227DRAFT_249685 [Lentinus tigrinus ALCF2SS1-6]|uniref:Uncharacterized protein n=2 Tax=Lentinus tigrinus TaxID=5365 RepID=A0A5C2S008_9APHY|nr:hypothetical protein L227DRAFT_249685 [Lentinus tigrinus ALCF2SS1-6]